MAGVLQTDQHDRAGLLDSVAALATGAAVGLLVALIAVSFAALIFQGPAAHLVGQGVTRMLLAAVAILGLLAFFGRTRGIAGSPQDSGAAVMAAAVASLSADVAPGALLPTIVAVMGLAAGLTGVIMIIGSRVGINAIAQYVPRPVIAGFLAGTGWVLLSGGVQIASGLALAPGNLGALAQPEMIVRWAPAVLVGVGLTVVLSRVSSPLVLPGTLVAVVLAVHVMLQGAGLNLDEARQAGLLLDVGAGQAVGEVLAVSLTSADGAAVLAALPYVGTAVLVSLLAALLNLTGIAAAHDDIDIAEQVRLAGWGSLASGLAGGVSTYQSPAVSALMSTPAGPTARRLAGVGSVAAVSVILLAGTEMLALIPVAAIGGLVVLPGASLLSEWALNIRQELPRAEYVVVLLVAGVVAIWGFLPGTLVGLVAAVVLFVVEVSSLDPVRRRLVGPECRSNVDRTPSESGVLDEELVGVQVLVLGGHLFFGTVERLVKRIQALLESSDPEIRALVLDVSGVERVDSSAREAWRRLTARHVEGRGPQILLAGPRALVHALDPAAEPHQDADRAVEVIEEQILVERATTSDDGGQVDRWVGLAPHVKTMTFAAGQTVRPDEGTGHDVLIVRDGRIRVTSGEGRSEVRLRDLAPGSIIGEVGHYLGQRTAVTVVALTDVTVWRLDEATLRSLERDDPALAARTHRLIAEAMADRMSRAVRLVDALRR